jgi:TIR domain/SIR2-like domain
MSSVAPFSQPIQTLDDDAWEDLLNFIEERQVIPIVGPELLLVETEGGRRLLYDWLAEKLAAKLGVDTALLPKPCTLNDVVCWFLASHGRREEAYTRLRSILRDANFAPPLALRQLAQITDFDLFVTTTFDPLLEQAINAERFQGAQSTEVIAYSPNRVADLPTEREKLQRPVLYHLLGRLSASPTYVISDEDTLEFICALQSEHLTPEKLFHELEHSHLLLIGSSFTNWLARLFLRMTKRHRLSDPRDVGEILADNHTDRDGRLLTFLQQVSVRTRIYNGAEKFVDELHRRWTIRRKPGDVIALGTGPQRFMPPEREMPDNAVFISYAREDLAAVQKLKAGLDAAGVKTWFDVERLESGDDYDRKIQRNISRCSYFIPIVSAATERRLEGYFRREWSYAIDRSRNMAEGALFILPVCVDDTDSGGAQVPDKFKAVHFTRLPGGEVSVDFARRLQDLLSGRKS